VVVARQQRAPPGSADVPEIPDAKRGQLSGADIEGIVGRAWRRSLLTGDDHITRAAMHEALAGFLPMAQSLERELQTLAAIIECTDLEFLPAAIDAKINELGGRARVQERLNKLQAVVDGG
jgi:hypothetical protein